MAKQTINIGTSANKGDGEPLRTDLIRLMIILMNCIQELAIQKQVQ